jgi:hypothetical protein
VEPGGAGGNRTPVRRVDDDRATTIPVDYGVSAAVPPGRLASRGGRRRVFPRGQRSFTRSAVFPAVNHRFCCQAAVVRPRVPLQAATALVSPDDQAARAYCSLVSAVVLVAPFKESEQLRSHDAPSGLHVETDQPLVK